MIRSARTGIWLVCMIAIGCQTPPTTSDARARMAEAYFASARRALASGDSEAAVHLYHHAISADPSHALANRDLAAAYLRCGKPAMGLPFAMKAVWLLPEDVGAHANLGAIQASLDRPGEAIASFRRAIELEGLTPPLMYNLGDALMADAQWTEAAALFEQLVQSKRSADHYAHLGRAYFHLRRPSESVGAYRIALELKPDHVASLNGLGASLMLWDQMSSVSDPSRRRDALDAWRRSLKIQPDQPVVANLINTYGR